MFLIPEKAKKAAEILAAFRLKKEPSPRLPETLRSQNSLEALQCQFALFEQLQQPILGWKAGLPQEKGWIMAPIGRAEQGTRCQFEWPASEYHVEPEFAFVLGSDLPSREKPYSEAEIDASIGSVHLALELIIRPYHLEAGASFLDELSAGLFNQGVYLGPEVTSAPAECVLHLGYQQQRFSFAAKHPAAQAKAPLYWLVNQLSALGVGLFKGQCVVTGSYAGVWAVPSGTDITVSYEGIAEFSLHLEP